MQLERIRFQDVFSFWSDLRGRQNPRYALKHFICLVETDRPLHLLYELLYICQWSIASVHTSISDEEACYPVYSSKF